MCGRITRTSPQEVIAKEFGVTRFAEVDWRPHYNVVPSQIVETIISVSGEKRLGPMRWGFVSPWRSERPPLTVRRRAVLMDQDQQPRVQQARNRAELSAVARDSGG
jgi:putative SOS response-associated peptidase YedK